MASDLGLACWLVSSYLCLSTILHRISGLSCLIPSSGYLPKQGVPQLGLPPSGMVFFFYSKFLRATGMYLPEGQSVIHLSEPSAVLARLLGDVHCTGSNKIAGFH
jgi:hypothetical protein